MVSNCSATLSPLRKKIQINQNQHLKSKFNKTLMLDLRCMLCKQSHNKPYGLITNLKNYNFQLLPFRSPPLSHWRCCFLDTLLGTPDDDPCIHSIQLAAYPQYLYSPANSSVHWWIPIIVTCFRDNLQKHFLIHPLPELYYSPKVTNCTQRSTSSWPLTNRRVQSLLLYELWSSRMSRKSVATCYWFQIIFVLRTLF